MQDNLTSNAKIRAVGDCIARLVAEICEINIKIDNIEFFLASDEADNMAQGMADLLRKQLVYMRGYSDVLEDRRSLILQDLQPKHLHPPTIIV